MRTYPKTLEDIKEMMHVAIYIRINPSCMSSYSYYENKLLEIIKEHPNWIYVGSYADGTWATAPLEKRIGFRNLLDECRTGNVDLIITNSISRISRNVLECVQITKMLAEFSHPVGIYFHTENIYSLDSQWDSAIGGQWICGK